MNREGFSEFYKDLVQEYYSRMIGKGAEYSTDEDAFDNFKTAAGILGGTQEQALLGFVTKHIVSIRDLIIADDLDNYEMVNEKIGDIIVYMVLLLGMIKERDNGGFETTRVS